MPDDKQRLRPEARPAWDRLDADQREGFDRIVAMLQAAVDGADPWSAAGTSTLPSIERNRTSRTILLDGRRGTGKTTLLLTLLDALLYRGPSNDDRWPEYRALRSRLVWLESLDMEPLDRSTSLLGAVLVRLEGAVGQVLHERGRAASRPRDLRLPTPWSGEVMQDLHELQTRAIATFDGNLRARAGSMDPDTFAVESLRAEHMRMGLATRFAEVVSGLAQTIQQERRGDPPIFVLPVDDLDLNPNGCVPLLELVRAVHSPHLIVIVLADLEVVDTALRLKFQREFIDAGGSSQLDERTAEQAADLAINSRRKHLPREQWVRLAPADPAYALGFRPFDSEGDVDLGTMLADCRLATDQLRLPGSDTVVLSAPERTLAMLDRPPTTPVTDPVDRAARHQSTWAEYFRLPLRELVDLHREAGHHDRAGKELLLTELAEPRLAPVRDALDRTREAVLARPVLRWTRDGAREGPSIETATISRWTLPIEAGLGRRDLPAIIGALDMRGVREQFGDDEYRLAQVSLRRTASAEDDTRVDWPMPQHSTAFGLEHTAAQLEQADRAWDDDDWLFGAWIATMTTVLVEALPVPRAITADWAAITDTLNDLIGQPVMRQWYAHVLSLCVPEMGMTNRRATEMWALPPGRNYRRVTQRAEALRKDRPLPPDLGRLRSRWPRSSTEPS